MKKISILIPTYNEVNNVRPIAEALQNVLKQELTQYSWEILFIDNHSTDGTRDVLMKLCEENSCIKSIFNARNFGQFNSPFYGLCQTSGDCTILICADFQDPVELIPRFVQEWENGHKIVCGIKKSSHENPVVYFLRSCYYKAIKKMSNVEQIEHFTGFGLYDKRFIDVLKSIDDPTPFLRGIVAELGYDRIDIPYVQKKRKAGKTKNNWYSLYDAAMLSFTSYTKIGLRLATFLGSLCALASFIIAFVYLILKLIFWNQFVAGVLPILVGVFLLGGIQLFFIGLMGEYLFAINTRVMNRPLVIEEKRINFPEKDELKNPEE